MPATTCTGYLRGDDLAHAYAAADAFVFPAMNETLGIVVLEAMASGLPVIAPRSGGLPDHVTHARNGLLFEPHDVHDLVAAAQRLVRFPDYAHSLGRAGRLHAETRRWEGVLDGLMDDYALIVRRHARLVRAQRVKRIALVLP